MVAIPVAAWDPQYIQEEGWTLHSYTLQSGNVLRFAAQDVRRERTGIHAKVCIFMNWVALAHSNFNIERDEERVRLANSAYSHLDDKTHNVDRDEFPKNQFKHALDLFCMGIWDYQVGAQMGDWMEGDPDTPAARPLLGNYILEGAGTILYAPPGQGKSFTAMAWASSLMYGIDTIWQLHDTRIPLYVNLERDARSMQGRLAVVNKALGIDARSPIPFLNARGRSLSDVFEAAKRTIAQHSCEVVFYDSISRAGGGGSMVADDVANRIMDMLNSLCPTWVAIGHSPRADDGHVYGSQMFTAAADLEVQLKSQTSTLEGCTGVGLTVTKANDIPTGGMTMHVLEWGDAGLTGIRKARPGEFSEVEAGVKHGLEDEMAQFIDTNGTISATALAKTLGKNRSNVANILASSKRFQVAGRDGREVLYGLSTERVAWATEGNTYGNS